MANKRIELEQYKYYFDILQEEPNRKTWLKGIQIAFIAAALLALAIFILGMLSSSLAKNVSNVLEMPPAKQSPTQQTTPSGVSPGGTQSPLTPSGGQQNIPVTPSPGGKAPSAPLAERATYGIPYGGNGGALIAQAQPATSVATKLQAQTVSSPATPINVQQSTPETTTSSAPGQTSGKKASAKSKGPGEQTKGVGNLGNLANGVRGSGFQLYLLVIFIGLLIILYLPVRKARLERKSK